MKNYKDNKITIDELEIWGKNKSRNPRTKRLIKQGSTIYKYIENEYIEYKKIKDKSNYKWEDSINNIDPISLEVIWKIEDNKKIKGELDNNNLVFIKEDEGVYCFKIESIIYMKENNILKNPISNRDFDIDFINKVERKYNNLLLKNKIVPLKKQSLTISELAFTVFQKFSLISIYIEHKLFLELDDDELNKLYYEMKDMYEKNIPEEIQEQIYKKYKVFDLTIGESKIEDVINIKKILLDNMNFLLSYESDELKYMIIYILVGSLSVVIPSIRENYPDFCFTFEV